MTAQMRASIAQLGPASRVFVVFTALIGIAYPLAMTGVAQLAFNGKADGSLIHLDGHVVGSSLIGQHFSGESYFHGRPSASNNDPLASGASNLGPNSSDLLTLIDERRAAAAQRDGIDPADVAPDALLASGSGLDPQISPAYAHEQIARVAQARGLDESAVRRLVDANTDGRALGFLGEPAVNVVTLNLALDNLTPSGAADGTD